MTTHIETSNNNRALSDAELADVNGGAIWLAFAVGAAAGFAVGAIVRDTRGDTITMGDLLNRHGY